MLQMSAFSHTILGTYALIGFTITGLSFLRSWVQQQYKGSLHILKEQCDRLRQTVNSQNQRIEGLKDLVARTTAQRDRQAVEIQQLRAEIERLSTGYTDLHTHQQALEAELASYRQQVQDLQAELANAQAENEALRDRCDRHRAEMEAAYERNIQLEASYQQQSATLATLQIAHAEQETQLQTCYTHLQHRDTVIATLENALEALHQQHAQSRIYTQLWAWISGVMTLACMIMGAGPWSPLRPVWEAIYPHLPMFY